MRSFSPGEKSDSLRCVFGAFFPTCGPLALARRAPRCVLRSKKQNARRRSSGQGYTRPQVGKQRAKNRPHGGTLLARAIRPPVGENAPKRERKEAFSSPGLQYRKSEKRAKNRSHGDAYLARATGSPLRKSEKNAPKTERSEALFLCTWRIFFIESVG